MIVYIHVDAHCVWQCLDRIQNYNYAGYVNTFIAKQKLEGIQVDICLSQLTNIGSKVVKSVVSLLEVVNERHLLYSL